MLNSLYKLIGHIVCVLQQIIWELRDTLVPPKQSAVLFVAHPDDDVLFFYQFLKAYKPYVVCLTTGGLLRRSIPFYRAMRHFSVRYRCYDMSSKAVEKEKLITKRINAILKKGSFVVCATHSRTGEYGHVMHQCVYRCVRKEWTHNLLVPVSGNEIEKYPLSEKDKVDKLEVLQKYYKNEYPTLESFHIWIANEKLVLDEG